MRSRSYRKKTMTRQNAVSQIRECWRLYKNCFRHVITTSVFALLLFVAATTPSFAQTRDDGPDANCSNPMITTRSVGANWFEKSLGDVIVTVDPCALAHLETSQDTSSFAVKDNADLVIWIEGNTHFYQRLVATYLPDIVSAPCSSPMVIVPASVHDAPFAGADSMIQGAYVTCGAQEY